jgi:hypothetical protein
VSEGNAEDLLAYHQAILADTRDQVIDQLAEFFQDSFDENPVGVADWLAQGGTTPDLFIHLVVALRRSLPAPPVEAKSEVGG